MTLAPPDVPELAASIAGEHFDFLKRIHIRLIANAVVDRIIHVDAIEQEVVRLFTIAINLRVATRSLESALKYSWLPGWC